MMTGDRLGGENDGYHGDLAGSRVNDGLVGQIFINST